jgi:hypothetical protein
MDMPKECEALMPKAHFQYVVSRVQPKTHERPGRLRERQDTTFKSDQLLRGTPAAWILRKAQDADITRWPKLHYMSSRWNEVMVNFNEGRLRLPFCNQSRRLRRTKVEPTGSQRKVGIIQQAMLNFPYLNVKCMNSRTSKRSIRGSDRDSYWHPAQDASLQSLRHFLLEPGNEAARK